MKKLILLVIIACILCFNGCGTCSDKEILRIPSPDGKVEAIMVERNCGATTAYAYRIYIVPKGESIKYSTPVFVADHLDGEKLEWVSLKSLQIKYKKARIFEFTNFWESREVDNFDYKVEINEVQAQ